jgi:hypothetical protein
MKSRSDCDCPCHSGAVLVHPVPCCDGLWTEWRIQFARHTRGATVRLAKYSRPRASSDYDRCEACFVKFMETAAAPGVLTEGYVTQDGRHWICGQCFRDLKDAMGWRLVKQQSAAG